MRLYRKEVQIYRVDGLPYNATKLRLTWYYILGVTVWRKIESYRPKKKRPTDLGESEPLT